MTDERADLAAAIRDACLAAAIDAYEQAGLSGLCAEGRWEVAMDALRSLDVETVARKGHPGAGAEGA